MLAVRIENDSIRVGDRFAVSFQRTLRIPDDGRLYPLPPGLGRFPILQRRGLPRWHATAVARRWAVYSFRCTSARRSGFLSAPPPGSRMPSPCLWAVSTPSRENSTTVSCIRNPRIISYAQTSPGWMALTPGWAQSASLSRCLLEQGTQLNQSRAKKRLAASKSQSLSLSQEDFPTSRRYQPVP